ncbi:MAG: aldo/keto reductase [Clostridiales bacterium]|nr:aldo/keto reductase [Clostridiales bacterium]
MFTRTMNGFDKPVSVLGFGCMRFPTTEDGKIDKARARAMLLHAHKMGVNYYDTAYPYHGGESEIVVGEVLKEIPRDEYFLTTKLPVWEIKTREDAEAMFEKQLGKLQQDYLDLYLLHAMNEDRFQEMEDAGVIDFMFDLKKQGKIKNVGFSFHDDYPVFEKWIKKYPWDACQIQFNFMDIENQAGTKGLLLAESLGIPVIVMEPIRGGSLCMYPDDLLSELNQIRPGKSKASWALRFVASFENVKVILSGMSAEDQLEDNLDTFNRYEAMTEEELAAMGRLKEALDARVYNPCTGCRYCMPCPGGVNIPGSFRIWNEFGKYGNVGHSKWEWSNMSAEEKPENCMWCGACEEQCPQKINIREDLVKVTELLQSL